MNKDINILVVDDVPQNLVAIKAMLASPGLNIITATSGNEALEILLVEDIALALLDVQMPNMDGFELAELIRGSARTRDVPLIFLTAGRREATNAFRGYDAGAVDFLYKPIEEVVLKSKVRVFVELYAKEKQLAQQLEDLRQALMLNELFIAVLGHDLRTPLSAVMNGTELLRKASQEPIVHSTANRMQSATRRMTEMVEQLLDVARIRAGNIEMKLKESDYHQLCHSIAEELGADKRSAVQIDAQGNTKGVVDADRMLQVLSNLLCNAVQHGSPDTKVHVSVDGTAASEIRITVANAGAIPAAAIDSIFEPFTSRHSMQKANQGLGLGLYIVKKFVEAHGGTVTVASDETNGTRFTVAIPRHPAIQTQT